MPWHPCSFWRIVPSLTPAWLLGRSPRPARPLLSLLFAVESRAVTSVAVTIVICSAEQGSDEIPSLLQLVPHHSDYELAGAPAPQPSSGARLPAERGLSRLCSLWARLWAAMGGLCVRQDRLGSVLQLWLRWCEVALHLRPVPSLPLQWQVPPPAWLSPSCFRTWVEEEVRVSLAFSDPITMFLAAIGAFPHRSIVLISYSECTVG